MVAGMQSRLLPAIRLGAGLAIFELQPESLQALQGISNKLMLLVFGEFSCEPEHSVQARARLI
jgi:hypothetical protein